MASDRETELRLSRLENDTESLYELVSDVKDTQLEHTRRFDVIDRRLGGMDRRFDGMDQRFDGIDRRLDGMDQRFDSVEATLAEIVRRLPERS